ncbi:BrnT family toxin [Oceanicola sp. D3]|uniref:BrnT family toxin n=1 Tax=Oceanicola sp. D3 TaxID=2587163 RepID=UPI00112255C5|nr:BrnT family toxin [Oceanicola sp. D3]QDC08171.1 BrnT family toxin [Oceanicola sp. D3]
MKIAGVDWDAGNWPKCGKHGVSQAEIEHVLRTMTLRIPDPFPGEPRFRTAGQTPEGRHVFLVYMHREKDGALWLRPINARYMHAKEIRRYEDAKEAMAKPPE